MICGCTAGLVCPPAMNALTMDKFNRAGSLVVRVTVTPPTGAAVERLIGKATWTPNPTVALTGSTIFPRFTAVIVTVTGTLLLKKSLTINCAT